MCVGWPRFLSTQRAHINDASADPPQSRNALPREEKWTTHVDGKYVIPFCRRNVLRIGGLEHSRVVYQEINRTEALKSGSHCQLNVAFLPHIAAKRKSLCT